MGGEAPPGPLSLKGVITESSRTGGQEGPQDSLEETEGGSALRSSTLTPWLSPATPRTDRRSVPTSSEQSQSHGLLAGKVSPQSFRAT